MKSYSAYHLDSQEFNKYERITGVFVVLALIGFVTLLLIAVNNKGWFASKLDFYTTLSTASGIYKGTLVNALGVRIGWVDEVHIVGKNQAKIHLKILSKYRDLLKEGSKIAVARQFVVGEKNLELLLADAGAPLAEFAEIPSEQGVDLIDLASSPQPGIFIYQSSQKIGKLSAELQDNLASAEQLFAQFKTKSGDLYRKIDQKLDSSAVDKIALPLLSNLSSMGRELTTLANSLNQRQRLVHFVNNGNQALTLINQAAPDLLAKSAPLLDEITQASRNLNQLSQEFAKLLPQIEAASPDLLYLSQRSKLALDEAIVLMQAMQQSFFLKSHADKIKKEQQQKP